ncbi:MAG: hypothetical protein LAO20_13490 [Acidobacteriia bacterium]|nr:hypothetical protein [Terriglobia bacterium]
MAGLGLRDVFAALAPATTTSGGNYPLAFTIFNFGNSGDPGNCRWIQFV